MRVEEIEALSDPRVADYRDVRDADLRGRQGLFMVEGRLGVQRLVSGSRFRPRSVFVSRSAWLSLREDLARLPDEIPVFVAERSLLEQVVGFPLHRGCLAAAERGEEAPPEAVLPRPAPGARALVLDGLANADNVGGVFRNAMAFGAQGVLLCPRCVDPLYRKAVRVSMGGALCVPFARARDWPGDALRLQERGWRLLALDPGGAPLGEEPLAAEGEATALVLGSEGAGVSAPLLDAADRVVGIGMAPGVDSLNVATASGIALHWLGWRSAGGPCAPC